MKQRRFGKTNKMVSEIGLGTWQLGTKWGEPFNHQEAMAIFRKPLMSKASILLIPLMCITTGKARKPLVIF